MQNIHAKLEQARVGLIGQGLGNPLIIFRTFCSKGLEITDERAIDVFRTLVEEGKLMDFLSDPQKDRTIDSAERTPTTCRRIRGRV